MAIGIQGITSVTLTSMLALIGAIASSVALMPAASAQETNTVLDAVENISERRSGDYYQHRNKLSELNFMFGLGGFPDQRVNRDAAALSEAYRELIVLQTQNTPTIRVPDLPNPYTTSVQLLPASQFNSRVVGSELNFEPLPRQ